MNKLSFKIGLLFFVFIVMIEAFLFVILYQNLAEERVDEIMNNLLARGNTHRDVLEDHYDSSTLEHVGIMESQSQFKVVIIDENGEILVTSNPLEADMAEVIEHVKTEHIPLEGEIVDADWHTGTYIATDSPIEVEGTYKGHVIMFAETDYVSKPLRELSKQFIIAGIVTIILTIITIFILSRFVADPLIKMKEATEQMSEGHHDVDLKMDRKDELGELARAIKKLAHDLDALKESRNEFLASVSHELRTPLTYIKGYANLLNRPGLSDSEKEQYVTIINEEVDELTSLIKDLFELAKVDENNFTIEKESLAFSDWLKDLLLRIRPMIEEANMSLISEIEENIEAEIDPDRMAQVLQNIIHNAIKHSDDNRMITIQAKSVGEIIQIDVMDEGVGIASRDLPYVFDRLYRVEKSRSRESGGAGLGLAIAKEIVQAHGGKIDMTSEENVGTSVHITIPRR